MWVKTAVVVILLSSGIAGCGAAGKNGDDADGAARKMRTIEPVACDPKQGRVEHVDLNQDGTADIVKIYKENEDGDVLICREADMNFDGKKDVVLFFDAKGERKSDEVDLDFDGKIDIITIYDQGQVVRQELDTNSDGVVDRVRYIEKGLPVRLEGDTDGNGRVDYWEYYEGGKLIRIGSDINGDGRVDRWSRDATSPPETETAGAGEEASADEQQSGEAADKEAEGAQESADKTQETKNKK